MALWKSWAVLRSPQQVAGPEHMPVTSNDDGILTAVGN
jgi:hypothetical protein